MNPSATKSLSAPLDAQALASQGHALLKAQRAGEAADCYRAALQLQPGDAAAHVGLGVALQQLGQLEAAVQSYRQALALRPHLSGAQFNLGSCLLDLGRATEAEQALRLTLAMQPDHAGAQGNLGNALKLQQRMDEALAAYRHAIALQPGLALNHANLGALHRELGEVQAALDCYARAEALAPGSFALLSDRIFLLNYVQDAGLRRVEVQRYGEAVAAAARPFQSWSSRQPGGPLRVGIVSADLREHPVGYFLEACLAELAREHAGRIAILAYPNSNAEDALTARLRRLCQAWTPITGMADETAAQRVHQDGLDILIDLSGHTAGNRLPLFAWRPAPVQCSWLGDCGVTGVEAIDHLLVDRRIAPEGPLPETFLCFTPPRQPLEVAPLPALANGYVTFGCFNKLAKLNDEVLRTWARILAAVPQSRLLLKAGALSEAGHRARWAKRLAAFGLAPERVVLEGASPRDDYLRAYGRMDIALDPFPYPGGTTSVEGLWMGVPMLTLAGGSPLARQGLSIAHNMQMDDWVAADAGDYVQRAVQHAQDPVRLAALRSKLRPRLLASPLCDAPRFARHLVEALEALRPPRA